MTTLTFLTIDAALVFGSLLLGAQGIAALVVMITLGLAYPLAYLPTALIYFNAAAVPLLFLWNGRAVRIGAALLVCLAIGRYPGLLSRIEAGRIRARIEREAVLHPIGGGARHVELRYDLDPDYPPLEAVVCGPICRRLVLGDAADTVTITTTERGEDAVSTTFAAASGDACVRSEVATGEVRCVIPRFGNAVPPDLTVSQAWTWTIRERSPMG